MLFPVDASAIAARVASRFSCLTPAVHLLTGSGPDDDGVVYTAVLFAARSTHRVAVRARTPERALSTALGKWVGLHVEAAEADVERSMRELTN